MDVSMMFWKVREFNNLGIGHFVPAVPSAREKCQVCLLYRYTHSNPISKLSCLQLDGCLAHVFREHTLPENFDFYSCNKSFWDVPPSDYMCTSRLCLHVRSFICEHNTLGPCRSQWSSSQHSQWRLGKGLSLLSGHL